MRDHPPKPEINLMLLSPPTPREIGVWQQAAEQEIRSLKRTAEKSVKLFRWLALILPKSFVNKHIEQACTRLSDKQRGAEQLQYLHPEQDEDKLIEYLKLCRVYGTLHHYQKRMLAQDRFPTRLEYELAVAHKEEVIQATINKKKMKRVYLQETE
ncbi:MAG: hypothetical protein IE928_10455 [Gammaproteobacteria bacterium]|nr:hypothetical protein [Gammaproteobacteria bacterium]